MISKTKNLVTVSVIIPSYNSFDTIQASINSILAQTYKQLEIIVIDDGSTDKGFDDLVKTYNNYGRIKFLRLGANAGVWHARNVGIEASVGRFIAFCDADDIWYTRKLEKQVALLKRTNAHIVFSSYDIIDATGKIISQNSITKNVVSYQDMLYRNHIGNLTAVVDTRYCGKPRLQNIRHEDYAMWLELMHSGSSKVIGINESLAGYRIHAANLTKNKLKSLVWHYRVLRDAAKLSVLDALYFTLIGRAQLMLQRLKSSKFVSF